MKASSRAIDAAEYDLLTLHVNILVDETKKKKL